MSYVWDIELVLDTQTLRRHMVVGVYCLKNDNVIIEKKYTICRYIKNVMEHVVKGHFQYHLIFSVFNLLISYVVS